MVYGLAMLIHETVGHLYKTIVIPGKLKEDDYIGTNLVNPRDHQVRHF